MRKGTAYVGTSGWQYRHWRGSFYPEDLPKTAWLSYYAEQFGFVEVDKSFHRLPERGAFLGWLADTPDPFRFTVLAPRVVTHQKKLKNCETEMDRLLTRLGGLGERVGPLLFRLPPRWRCNARRLEGFLARLPETFRYAFEARDPSWHCDAVYRLLAEHGAAFCVFDVDGETSPLESTADFVYVRLQGPADGPTGNYSPQTLRGWAGKANGWLRKGKDVYLVFEDDERDYAAKNAQRIGRYLKRRH